MRGGLWAWFLRAAGGGHLLFFCVVYHCAMGVCDTLGDRKFPRVGGGFQDAVVTYASGKRCAIRGIAGL